MKRQFEIKTPDLIVWNGSIVMSRSEEPLLKTLFQELTSFKPKRLLEVGFGLGISSALIQRILKPKYHDIVEIDAAIYRDLKKFAAKKAGINGIRGDFWNFKRTHFYDFMFYDAFDYSSSDYVTEENLVKNSRKFSKRFDELLERGGFVCWPHFGNGKPQKIYGYHRVIFKHLTVPAYPLWDGTYTTKAAIVCWMKP